MIKKNFSKKVMLLLAFVMAFGMLITPNIAEAADAVIDNTKAGAYIKVEADDISAESYIRITTLGGGSYGKVVRGNIFLTFPQGTDLTAVPVILEADGFDFTLDDTTVISGDSELFILNLVEENVATLDVPSDYDEGTYVITGGLVGETIDVEASISVEYPKQWLAGQYDQPGYPAESPATNPDTAKVTDAVAGFDTLSPVTYTVPEGTTAMDILEKYGTDFNMNITGINNGYISRMGVNPHQQIGEFDINYYSGWMYTVNEDGAGWYLPNVGASAKTLTEDTEMIWHFTMAYGADIGAPWGAPDGDPGMPFSMSMNRLSKSVIGHIIPQWANSGR